MTPMPSTPTARLAPRALALLGFAFALAADAALAAAQQRVEIVTTRRAPRPEVDSAERAVQRLKQRADSLAREYNENASAGDRQRIGAELDRTIGELEHELLLLQRMVRAGSGVGVRMAPMASARDAEVMSRTLSNGGVVDPTPRGWLGIVVNGVAREPRIERGELLVHYLTYPEILSVDPSSPAERAGLAPGDTLIAYDGRDVRDADISMTRLLKPNARVLVRIAREGRQRDVPVTIADAPSRIRLRGERLTEATLETMPDVMARASAPRFPGAPVAPSAPPPGGAFGRVGTVAPAAPAAPAPVAFSGLMGAQMGTLTRDWIPLTGVKAGVLVMRAPEGSLAAESGLRDADVIVKAAGQAVRTLPELRNLIAIAWGNGERAIAIEYVRERKARGGVLRW